jgi:hypothetical protein
MKNKTQSCGCITQTSPSTGTWYPYDDGFCHCDEVCPCCGKRKRRCKPFIYPPTTNPIYVHTGPLPTATWNYTY